MEKVSSFLICVNVNLATFSFAIGKVFVSQRCFLHSTYLSWPFMASVVSKGKIS